MGFSLIQIECSFFIRGARLGGRAKRALAASLHARRTEQKKKAFRSEIHGYEDLPAMVRWKERWAERPLARNLFGLLTVACAAVCRGMPTGKPLGGFMGMRRSMSSGLALCVAGAGTGPSGWITIRPSSVSVKGAALPRASKIAVDARWFSTKIPRPVASPACREFFAVGIPRFKGHLANVIDCEERVRRKQHDVLTADDITLFCDDAPGREHGAGLRPGPLAMNATSPESLRTALPKGLFLGINARPPMTVPGWATLQRNAYPVDGCWAFTAGDNARAAMRTTCAMVFINLPFFRLALGHTLGLRRSDRLSPTNLLLVPLRCEPR